MMYIINEIASLNRGKNSEYFIRLFPIRTATDIETDELTALGFLLLSVNISQK